MKLLFEFPCRIAFIDKLISPPLNIIGSTAPILKFSFTNVSFAGNTEELKVFYKTGLNEPWFLLGTTAVEVNNWVEISINLPDPSGDYYIAFEGTSNYARGLTLDDISKKYHQKEAFLQYQPNQILQD